MPSESFRQYRQGVAEENDSLGPGRSGKTASPAMRSVETGRRPRVSRFQIRFSEGDAEYEAGKEEENQGEETFGQEETVLRNSLSERQIIS